MSIAITFGFARAFIWHTVAFPKNAVNKESGESQKSYENRPRGERYNIYTNHFKDVPAFNMEKGMIYSKNMLSFQILFIYLLSHNYNTVTSCTTAKLIYSYMSENNTTYKG